MRSRTAWISAAATAIALSITVDAAADDACNEAYTQTQILRRAGKLRAARQAIFTCSQETCTSAVRTDCVKWADEIERALSTLVFDVRKPDGTEVTDVKVYAGEELLASTIDGRQVSMDPGEIVLRFVRGAEVIEKRVVIREGEKFRTLRVELSASATTSPIAPPPPPRAKVEATVEDGAARPAASARGLPTASWILGGVAASGFLTFGVLAGVGYGNESDLRDGCFRTLSCSPDDVSSVRTQYLVGDIGLGIGIVSLAAAVGLWLLDRGAPASRAATGEAK
ncbi:MAG: hypothetical protein JST00_23805 [Deltaproteobacteria bacterium]|nr:hypothetical protein [Deltaproteobacteria bacterium]